VSVIGGEREPMHSWGETH